MALLAIPFGQPIWPVTLAGPFGLARLALARLPKCSGPIFQKMRPERLFWTPECPWSLIPGPRLGLYFWALGALFGLGPSRVPWRYGACCLTASFFSEGGIH